MVEQVVVNHTRRPRSEFFWHNYKGSTYIVIFWSHRQLLSRFFPSAWLYVMSYKGVEFSAPYLLHCVLKCLVVKWSIHRASNIKVGRVLWSGSVIVLFLTPRSVPLRSQPSCISEWQRNSVWVNHAIDWHPVHSKAFSSCCVCRNQG